MPDQVQIRFGADIADALSGLNALKQAIAAIAEPVSQLTAAFAAANAILTVNMRAMVDDHRTTLSETLDSQARYLTEMGAAAGQQADALVPAFQRAFERIGWGWHSAMTGVLNGTETIGKAASQIGRAVENSFISILGRVASQAVAGPLSRLLGTGQTVPGGGISDVLAGFLGKQVGNLFSLGNIGQNAAQIANTTALGINTAAIGVNTTALLGGATANAASGASNLLGGGASLAGGAASVAGGGGLFGWLGGLLAFSGGGLVPSAAGGWSLPNFAGATPAMLHGGEMVLPQHISQWVQNAAAGGTTGGASGGDVNLHFHGPADGPAIERFLSPMIRRAIPGAVRGAFRSNSLTDRTF